MKNENENDHSSKSNLKLVIGKVTEVDVKFTMSWYVHVAWQHCPQYIAEGSALKYT
jgi:hypothetical protein